ncbi:unnamed protein product [Paramecium sonneborni]|uniref:Uncharacterized protein n=1 Tax=Paramecium sonneborni TaxID=65129 RepID=A0A8S1P1Q0_9CILI|nr:unnamed protein product [Paramecium sonneborni]
MLSTTKFISFIKLKIKQAQGRIHKIQHNDNLRFYILIAYGRRIKLKIYKLFMIFDQYTYCMGVLQNSVNIRKKKINNESIVCQIILGTLHDYDIKSYYFLSYFIRSKFKQLLIIFLQQNNNCIKKFKKTYIYLKL